MRTVTACGFPGDDPFKRHLWGRQRKHRASSRLHASSMNRTGYWSRVQGWRGPLKAGLISGTLSACGDLIAQALVYKDSQADSASSPFSYDPSRTLRMLGFGLLYYGPLQYYWYNLLDWTMPTRNVPNFLAKVGANQLILAPLVLTGVFAWTLTLTGQQEKLRKKVEVDLLPAMIVGWKFWIPAASLNFFAIPLQHQVLYMSACGVVWTAYLSYASSSNVARDQAKKAS